MNRTRRNIVAGLSALMAAVLTANVDAAENALAALERKNGGRLGVFALDTGSGRRLVHRADERFLMCSTFKIFAVAAVLAKVDSGHEQLDRRISYTAADLLDYAPVTRAHVMDGALSIEMLCQAAIEVSDNTAANLLLSTIDGPHGVTCYVRGFGDIVTRLDRNEPTLNQPDGILDTTSPRAMVDSMRTVLLGKALSRASRERLADWMIASTRGLARLRAGLPRRWRVGDKAGTGNAETNDIAIIQAPDRAPLLVAAYYKAAKMDESARETVLRDVGAIISAWAA